MTELGIALLVVGAVVAVAEVHYPSHGVVGGVGVIAMAIGAVLAISGLGAGVLLGVLSGVALASAGVGVLALSVKQGTRVAGRRVRTGAEGIVGHIGVVRNWSEPNGSVAVDGALWHARRSTGHEPELEIQAGDPVVVERLTGLTLSVRRAEEWELP
jgi:membrane-bound serine protease (ClpP class)